MTKMAPSSLAQWFAAVGTFAAVIVALFKDAIIGRRRRPRLKATCRKETPWTVKTPAMAQGYVSGKGTVVWTGDSYYVRTKVEKTGRTRAEKVQASAQKLEKQGADKRFVDLPTILPLNLKWSNIGVPILDGISPKMSYFCDIIAIFEPSCPTKNQPVHRRM
jgi:hypothetical protein